MEAWCLELERRLVGLLALWLGLAAWARCKRMPRRFLIILSQKEQKEIAHVTADENGNYRAPLPPGAYILDVQGRVPKGLRAKPQPFTVVSNQTVRVDMNILIGLARIRP